MKPLNFDWMFTSCHPFSEVASAYFTNVRTDSATRLLRKQVVFYPALYAELCGTGYTEHTTVLTPLHIAALIRAWGLPAGACKALADIVMYCSRHRLGCVSRSMLF